MVCHQAQSRQAAIGPAAPPAPGRAGLPLAPGPDRLLRWHGRIRTGLKQLFCAGAQPLVAASRPLSNGATPGQAQDRPAGAGGWWRALRPAGAPIAAAPAAAASVGEVIGSDQPGWRASPARPHPVLTGPLAALAQRITPLLLLLSQLPGPLTPGPLAAAAASVSPGCEAAQSLAQRQERLLLRQLPRLEVLLLAEIHTSVADHLWQLRSLQLLHARRPLSLALEMLPAPRQPLLSRYGAGQLSDQAFLQQVEWQQVWGHDPDLVLPLLRWARRQGLPLLAINAEPELVRRVRRQGLEAIAPEARQGIGTPVAAPASERQRLEAIWRLHRLHRLPAAAAAADLERFIASQLLRDRAMAEAIAAARRQAPERLVVVLIGQGHLEGEGGVPLQLRDLGLTRILALRRPPQPAGCGPAPARARLGAYLESENGRVWVRQVAPGSAAAAAGIRPGDRILELNGTAVDHAGQVIRGVRLHPTGLPLQLLIERDGKRLLLRLPLPPSEEARQAGRENGVWSRPPSLPLAQSSP